MTVHNEQRSTPVRSGAFHSFRDDLGLALEEGISQDAPGVGGGGGLRARTNYGGSKDEVSYLVRRRHDGGVVWGGGYWIGGYDRYRERTPVQRVADVVHVHRW